MRSHPLTGAQILAPLELFEDGAVIVRHHHERLDGSGYPDRLAGAAIPVGARIVAVADVYDALASDRPYRGALPPREALRHLRSEGGRGLDGELVDRFAGMLRGAARAMRLLTAGFDPAAARLSASPARPLLELAAAATACSRSASSRRPPASVGQADGRSRWPRCTGAWSPERSPWSIAASGPGIAWVSRWPARSSAPRGCPRPPPWGWIAYVFPCSPWAGWARALPGWDGAGGPAARLRELAVGAAMGAVLGAHLLVTAALTFGYAVGHRPLSVSWCPGLRRGRQCAERDLFFHGGLFSWLWRRTDFGRATAGATAAMLARYLFDPALPRAVETAAGAVLLPGRSRGGLVRAPGSDGRRGARVCRHPRVLRRVPGAFGVVIAGLAAAWRSLWRWRSATAPPRRRAICSSFRRPGSRWRVAALPGARPGSPPGCSRPRWPCRWSRRRDSGRAPRRGVQRWPCRWPPVCAGPDGRRAARPGVEAARLARHPAGAREATVRRASRSGWDAWPSTCARALGVSSAGIVLGAGRRADRGQRPARRGAEPAIGGGLGGGAPAPASRHRTSETDGAVRPRAIRRERRCAG